MFEDKFTFSTGCKSHHFKSENDCLREKKQNKNRKMLTETNTCLLSIIPFLQTCTFQGSIYMAKWFNCIRGWVLHFSLNLLAQASRPALIKWERKCFLAWKMKVSHEWIICTCIFKIFSRQDFIHTVQSSLSKSDFITYLFM